MVEKETPVLKHKPFIRPMITDQPFWHERQLIVENKLFGNKQDRPE